MRIVKVVLALMWVGVIVQCVGILSNHKWVWLFGLGFFLSMLVLWAFCIWRVRRELP